VIESYTHGGGVSDENIQYAANAAVHAADVQTLWKIPCISQSPHQ